MRILTILTCHNRAEKTIAAVYQLVQGNPSLLLTFVVVDDGSTDDTSLRLQALGEAMKDSCVIHLLRGSGQLYYSGGMRKAMKYALSYFSQSFDYLLMINDDVEFIPRCVERMILQSKMQKNARGDAVVAGATKNRQGQLTYGAIVYTKGGHYHRLNPEEWRRKADTFNANCVLIPYRAFWEAGAIDERYIHSLGDFDYGLTLKRLGFSIHGSRDYVGICENNPMKGSWEDPDLSICQRLKKKKSVKGAPLGPWLYFLRKNFGLYRMFVSGFTPYLRILVEALRR